MDEVTQQNAALVEEAAAAAESLEEQARSLVRSVAMFQLQAVDPAAAQVVPVPDNVARLPERAARAGGTCCCSCPQGTQGGGRERGR
jgi:methyl-accepting chemotaxis protein